MVTAKAGDLTASCSVAVKGTEPVKPTDLSIYSVYGESVATDVTIKVGSDALMEVQGTDSAATWSIADTSIVTVDSSGMVTGVAVGETTLTATVDGQTLTCTIRIS